jgi:hypothetical protein
MRRSGPNMSAALAIAIERQVDAIVAAAKAKCTLHAHLGYIRASVRDDEKAARVFEILIRAGAHDAQLHNIRRESVWMNRPSTLAQPDPFLGNKSVGP